MLTTDQIIDLVTRRRLLLREQMNNDIARGQDKTRNYAATVAEYTSLELLLLAIKEGRPDVWDVAPERQLGDGRRLMIPGAR